MTLTMPSGSKPDDGGRWSSSHVVAWCSVPRWIIASGEAIAHSISASAALDAGSHDEHHDGIFGSLLAAAGSCCSMSREK